MQWNDSEFQDWLRRQSAVALDCDLIIYGTAAATSIMRMTVQAPQALGGGEFIETVIINAYPAVKLVVVTYPRVLIDATTRTFFPGVIRELPTRTPSDEHPDPVGVVFSCEVARHLSEGFRAVTESENA
jgi:hypothetical protein